MEVQQASYSKVAVGLATTVGLPGHLWAVTLPLLQPRAGQVWTQGVGLPGSRQEGHD